MKQYFKTASILAIICAVAALILASLNSVTAPVIVAYDKQQTINALNEVAHGYTLGDKVTTDSEVSPYYIPLVDEDGTVKGNILELKSNGYGGEIKLVASFDEAGLVLEAKVVSNSETPGLGKKSENSWYMTKFIGKDPIPTSKNQLSAEDNAAVSGASITFGAIAKALSEGGEYAKTLEAK
ncbi:MAG: FMN-binding protein [Sphaerochaeta sp.]